MAGRQGRAAVGCAIAHVKLVDELVNHHVVPACQMFAGRGNVLPAERDGPALHGFAGDLFFVKVVHTRRIHHATPRQHRAGVNHDACEVVIHLETQIQHGQAGLGGNRHGHLVCHFQAVRAAELFLR